MIYYKKDGKVYNCTKNINGKNFDIVRNNYYKDYYTRYNDIYITDFKDENGKLCRRIIDIVPKCTVKNKREYLGSNKQVKNSNQVKNNNKKGNIIA